MFNNTSNTWHTFCYSKSIVNNNTQVKFDDSESLVSAITNCGPTISKICLATPLVQMAISLSKGDSKLGKVKRSYRFNSFDTVKVG